MRSCWIIVLSAILSGLLGQPALAGKRVALVIGNSAYKSVPRLENPVNDAAAIAAIFKAANFDVVDTRVDLSVADMRRAMREFGGKARDSDIAIIYYAGHGIELDGNNYLIPVDARLETDTDIFDEALALDRALIAIEPAKQLRLVILDACRDNPYRKTMKRTIGSRSIERGLAKVEPSNPNTLIAFAVKAGYTADDGDGKNSPYTKALLGNLTKPGVDLRKAFGFVRDEVLKATNNRQEPFIYGSLGGDDLALVPVPGTAATIDANAAIRRDYELAERVGTKPAWDSFIRNYPGSFYTDLAVAQRDKLVAEAKPGETKAISSDRAKDTVQTVIDATPPGPARTLSGARLIAAEAPFICDSCREKIGRALNGQPDHTALALSWDGGYFWALNRSTAADARRNALGQCLDARKRACFVYAVDNRIVWLEPPPPLPPKPWFVRNGQMEQPLEFDKIPIFLAEQKRMMAQIYPREGGSKALVLGVARQWSMTGGVQSDEEAARAALERCGYITHSPCRVIAIGNAFVVPPASFKLDAAAAPAFAPSSSATGPAYSLAGPPLVPESIPFICDECRELTAKGLENQPLHTAVAISLEGGFWYNLGRASAEEARTIALGNCIGAGHTMCLVYAVDGQIVWRDTPPPLPAMPWFTHDPRIEHPLDIDAIANLSDESKKVIRNVYPKATSPKAIAVAVGNGSFALGYGIKFPPKTENEAARLALERCGFVTQAPCRIIAVNDNSVVK